MNQVTNTDLHAGMSLGMLAARLPIASRVFRDAGLDYCCGGSRSLAEACAERNLDPATVVRALQAEPAAPGPAWPEQPLPALVAHILEHYHEPLRRELVELREMAAKVEQVHAAKAACPQGLAAHLAAVHESVLSHLEKEEQILFPLILAGRGSQALGAIHVMETEHQDHGANLARTRLLAGDFVAPAEACATWKALYLRLAQLEADLMDHIHLENSVLFPRAACE